MNFDDPQIRKTLADFARLALGVLVALAWKEPIQYFATQFLPPGAAFLTLILFALGVTFFAVFMMVFIFKFVQPEADSDSEINSSPGVDDKIVTPKIDNSAGSASSTEVTDVNDSTTMNGL